jgi:purine-nucleoside phosphorylase
LHKDIWHTAQNPYICSMTIVQQINEAKNYLESKNIPKVNIGVVLGSGLGKFTAEMDISIEIPYGDIPHFPVSTVEGHSGKLIFGTINGKQIVAMAGRFHYYEGYSTDQVVFPIRVLKAIGVHTLLLSNAAGGVNAQMGIGELMIIKDHISFAIVNPLLGKNIDALGPRFPDMSEPYNKELIQKAKTIATNQNIKVMEGVYFGVTGPTFETRAEYKMIHTLGADAVGMSTVQEVIVARHMGMQVFAMSVITDLGIRDEENTITHQEVLEAANAAEPKFTLLFTELIKAM